MSTGSAAIDALIVAFRDYITQYVPGSGVNPPAKAEIRAAFTQLATELAAAATGQSIKTPVVAASTDNVDISSALINGASLDGITLATGDRVLLKDQTDPTQNGVYVTAASGAASRATDMDAGTEIRNANIYIEEGTVNAARVFVNTNATAPVIGTDAITFNLYQDFTAFLTDIIQPIADEAQEAADNASAIADAVKVTAPASTVFKVIDDDGYAGLEFTTEGMDIGAAGIKADKQGLRTPKGQFVFSDDGFGVRDENGYYFMWIPSTGLGGDLRPLITRIQALENNTNAGGNGSASWMHQDVAKTFPFPRAFITTHRGDVHTGTPENSIESIYASARAGFTIDETDMQFTSDGVPVIMHDATLDRTCKNASDYSDVTGGVRVDSVTAEYLRENYVLASDNVAYRRPVPTLEEACAAYSAVGIKPILEFKTGANTTVEQITTVWDIATRILGEDGFLFGGFYISAAFDYIRKNLTQKTFLWYYFDAATLTSDNLQSNIADCLAHQPAGLFINWANPVLPDAIEACHAVKVPVAVWTVAPDQFDYVVSLGADCIITDTLGPTPTVQNVLHKSYSGADWDDWTTTGALANGEVTLTEGETITLVSLPDSDIDYGAWYINGEFTGALTVTGTNIPSTDLTNDAAAFRSFNVCTRYAGSAVSITLTAGAGGAVVHSLNLCILKF